MAKTQKNTDDNKPRESCEVLFWVKGRPEAHFGFRERDVWYSYVTRVDYKDRRVAYWEIPSNPFAEAENG